MRSRLCLIQTSSQTPMTDLLSLLLNRHSDIKQMQLWTCLLELKGFDTVRIPLYMYSFMYLVIYFAQNVRQPWQLYG